MAPYVVIFYMRKSVWRVLYSERVLVSPCVRRDDRKAMQMLCVCLL